MLPLMTMLSVIANSFRFGQCCLMLCSTFFFYGQPCIIYAFSSCSYASHVAVCMSSVDVNTGMFTEVLMVLMCILIPVISWSLFSVWLLQHSLSVVYKSPCIGVFTA